MRSRCSARITSSRCTASVSCDSSSASSRTRAAHRRQLALARGALALRGVALGRGRGQRGGEAHERLLGGVADLGGDHGPAGPGRAGLGPAAPGRALDLGRAQQLVGPPVHGPHPLLAGAHRRAAPPSRPAGPRPPAACNASRSAVSGSVGSSVAASASRSRSSSSASPARSASRVCVDRGPGLVEAGGLGPGRARHLAQLGQLLGHGRELGVRLVQRLQRGLDVGPLDVGLLLGGRQLGVQPVVAGGGLVGLLPGLVDGSADLDGGRGRGRAAGRPVHPQDVAVPGDRADVGMVGDEAGGGGEVGDDGDVGERGGDAPAAATAGPARRRRPTRCPAAAPGGGAGAAGGVAGGADEQPGPAAVVGLEQLQRADGVGRRRDGDGVGDRAERGGDRGLVARTRR